MQNAEMLLRLKKISAICSLRSFFTTKVTKNHEGMINKKKKSRTYKPRGSENGGQFSSVSSFDANILREKNN